MKKGVWFLTGTIFLVFCTAGMCEDECTYVKSTDTYNRIRAAIEKIGVVDTHEHLVGEKEFLEQGATDFFDLVGDYYDAKDKRYLDKKLSVKERWQSFEPVYKDLKDRNYIKSLRCGIKKIYGIEITDADSIKKINKAMGKQRRPGIYKRIFRDIANMDFVMVQSRWQGGFPKEEYPDFFRGARVLDKMIVFTDAEDIREYEEHYGIEIRSVADFEKIYEKFAAESVRTGAVGFKYSGAYLRTLDFSNPSREKAEEVLQRFLRLTEAKFSWAGGQMGIEEMKELSTYLMHAMLRAIDAKGMTVAFHTGIVGKGRTYQSNPQLLIPLFKEYKNINFDLYHNGFPYVSESIELAKSWPNVYINMCWSQNLSPSLARRQMSEMLECTPINKFLAYGGDSRSPENAVGDLEIAKENCAIVLAEKVLNGYFTESEAIEYAERILRTNAVELYKLEVTKQ